MELSIREGSAAAPGFYMDENEVYFSKDPGIRDPMQQYVYDELGDTELAAELDIPLINLHSGEMIEVEVPNAYVYDKITLHKTLSEIDLLCSVPIVKTSSLRSNEPGWFPGGISTAGTEQRKFRHRHSVIGLPVLLRLL